MVKYISIGDHCAVAIFLRDYKLKGETLPFDWMGISLQTVIQTIKDIFLLKTNKEIEEYSDNFLTLYEQPHFDVKLQETKEKFRRRFQRLKNVLTSSDHLTFIHCTRFSPVELCVLEEFRSLIKSLRGDDFDTVCINTIKKDINSVSFPPHVRYTFIDYPKERYYEYDYTGFRVLVNNFLASILVS
jgi:hypothetical protein